MATRTIANTDITTALGYTPAPNANMTVTGTYGTALKVGTTGQGGRIDFLRGSDGTDAAYVGYSSAGGTTVGFLSSSATPTVFVDAANTGGKVELRINGTAMLAVAQASATFGVTTLATALNFDLTAAAGQVRQVRFLTDTRQRWVLRCAAAAESTGNLGSNFGVDAYADDGTTVLWTPIAIARSTGLVSMSRGAVISGGSSTIDGCVIGGTTPAAATVTSLTTNTGLVAGTTTGAATLNVDLVSATGQHRQVRFFSDTRQRWIVRAGNGPEVGSNAGSNFVVDAYADDGTTLLYSPISVLRSTGLVTMAKGAAISGGSSTIDGATIGATTASTASFTTVTASSTITPSQTAGIVGTTTNNNANAGSVGEVISATLASGSAVSLTTATAANVTSISLTAGDWDVSGEVWLTTASGAAPTLIQAGINATSATFGTGPGVGSRAVIASTTTTGQTPVLALAPCRQSLSGTTTVYLIGSATFGSGTVSAYGLIRARRMR